MTVKIAVLGNPVVDGISNVTDAKLAALNLKKGDSNLLDVQAMFQVGTEVEVELFQSGGSAANMAYTLSKLNFPVCFLGPLGTDPAGRHFFKEMVGAGLTLNNPAPAYRTTEIFVLVTPDGIRTMVQPRPPIPNHDVVWLDDTLLNGAQWLLVEGYVARDWPAAVREAVAHAKGNGAKVALQLPSPRTSHEAALSLGEVITAGVDLIIGNHQEYLALKDGMDALQVKMLDRTARVVTLSGEGAEFHDGQGAIIKQKTERIPNPKDNTGAGDAFAAGFMAVYAIGGDPAVALRRGHMLGGKVIQHLGPRLPDPMQVWLGASI